MTAPDPVAEFSAPILKHMNDDHPETTVAMVKHYITGDIEVMCAVGGDGSIDVGSNTTVVVLAVAAAVVFVCARARLFIMCVIVFSCVLATLENSTYRRGLSILVFQAPFSYMYRMIRPYVFSLYFIFPPKMINASFVTEGKLKMNK